MLLTASHPSPVDAVPRCRPEGSVQPCRAPGPMRPQIPVAQPSVPRTLGWDWCWVREVTPGPSREICLGDRPFGGSPCSECTVVSPAPGFLDQAFTAPILYWFVLQRCPLCCCTVTAYQSWPGLILFPPSQASTSAWTLTHSFFTLEYHLEDPCHRLFPAIQSLA